MNCAREIDNRRMSWVAATMFAAMLLITLGINSAHAGITATKHNLGTTGTAGNNHLTAGTGEICVFCHTPHGADTAAPAPLWNKALPAASSFQTYATLGTTTLEAAQAQIGSVSLACLSCHDGTQAMDNMINAPGSGGYTPGGARLAGATWTGPTVDPATGRLNANVITNIGTDLRNDHPISIQYCGGGIDATGVTATVSTKAVTACNDKDFKDVQAVAINGSPVFWVDTTAAGGTTGRRDKTDMILYSRAAGDFGSGSLVQPSVECASCHDPHTDTNPTFLRVSNTGSGVCLSCHVK